MRDVILVVQEAGHQGDHESGGGNGVGMDPLATSHRTGPIDQPVYGIPERLQTSSLPWPGFLR